MKVALVCDVIVTERSFMVLGTRGRKQYQYFITIAIVLLCLLCKPVSLVLVLFSTDSGPSPAMVLADTLIPTIW